MGPNPNIGFSPPSQHWNYIFQSEDIQNGSNDKIPLYESTSSNSKISRSSMRGGYHQSIQSAAESSGLNDSSPSETSLNNPWTLTPTRGVSINDVETAAKRGAVSETSCFSPMMEALTLPEVGGSFSFHSEGGELEHSGKLHLSTPRSYSSRRSFMSKPVHPLSFLVQEPSPETSASPGAGLFDYDATSSQRHSHRLSSGSNSIDSADISEPFEFHYLGRSSNQFEAFKCELCDRLLSQRSPWSSSADMVSGVLSCHHVFHAACLELTTPKSHRNDPPCPICTKVHEENSAEQRLFPRMRNGFSRLRAFSEEGSSKTWGCIQAGDCVEGALHTPRRRSMPLLDRNKVKKTAHGTGDSGMIIPDKLKKTASHPLNIFGGRFVDNGSGSCSEIAIRL